MKIDVRLFARARDLAGAPTVAVELSSGATVADLRAELLRIRPALAPVAQNLLVAVGSEYAADQHVLSDTAAVACFPPVSGG